MTKSGYKQRRHQLKQFHAQLANKVPTENEYEADAIHVASALLKGYAIKSGISAP